MEKCSLKDWIHINEKKIKVKFSGVPEYKDLTDEDLIYAILGTYGSNKDAPYRNFEVFIKDCLFGQFKEKGELLPIIGFLFGLKEKYFHSRSYYRINDKGLKYKFDMSNLFDQFMLACIFQYFFGQDYSSAENLLKENNPEFKDDHIM